MPLKAVHPFLCMTLALAGLDRAAAVEPIGDGPQPCMPAVIEALAPAARAALLRIDDLPRRILAASMYLKARSLESRWSWGEDQIRAYEASADHAEALAAIARVQDRFAALNPGYALRVNTTVRSLDAQIASWNVNESVAAAAAPLTQEEKDRCAPAAPQRYVTWLRGWKPATRPNLAPPGLSPHGQAQAFDFQVHKDGAAVAPADTSRIQSAWIEAGWAARLAEAVKDAGPAFHGPLLMPNEPWHYAYDPKAAANASAAPTASSVREPAPSGAKIIVPQPKPDWSERDGRR